MVEDSDPNVPWNMRPGTPPPFPERNGPAWEWRKQLGFFRALFLTIKEVLSRPTETFQCLKREGGLSSPLVFFLIVSIAVAIFDILITLPFQHSQEAFFSEIFKQQNETASFGGIAKVLTEPAGLALILLIQLIILPLALTFGLFISSGITHLLLALFGGARFPFEATFRVFAYGSGACALFGLIPFGCGTLIQWIVASAIIIIGLTKVHETDTWRVVLALLAPGLIVLTCLGALAIAVVMMIGASGTN